MRDHSHADSTLRTNRMHAEAKLAPRRAQPPALRLDDAINERIFDDGPAPTETPTRPTTTTPESAPRRDANAQLKLIVDRRTIPRRQIDMGAMAVFATDAGAGLITRVQLRDISWRGVGFTSPVEVSRGSTVRLTPEHAMVPPQLGTVVRCTPREDGESYDIGVRVHTTTKAA